MKFTNFESSLVLRGLLWSYKMLLIQFVMETCKIGKKTSPEIFIMLRDSFNVIVF